MVLSFPYDIDNISYIYIYMIANKNCLDERVMLKTQIDNASSERVMHKTQ